jgi:hypothetical protein
VLPELVPESLPLEVLLSVELVSDDEPPATDRDEGVGVGVGEGVSASAVTAAVRAASVPPEPPLVSARAIAGNPMSPITAIARARRERRIIGEPRRSMTLPRRSASAPVGTGAGRQNSMTEFALQAGAGRA